MRFAKKLVSTLVCTSLFLIPLSGCTLNHSDTANSQPKKYKKFITVDVFDPLANFQGIQSGWFGKIVKDKFNMKLNIIAPNVSDSGDNLFQTRSAAGNLGDLVVINTDSGRFKKIVSAGLMYDMTTLSKKEPHLQKYATIIRKMNLQVTSKGIYGIPSEISIQSPKHPTDESEPLVAPYIRWDAYRAAGSPKLANLESLIPVMKKMQALVPKSESGKKTYAISLFKDWDNNVIVSAKNYAALYGYIDTGFTLSKPDGSDIQDITSKNGIYVRALHFLFQANQAGLVDPESTTQTYETLAKKYRDGQILTSLWAFQGQSLYNTLSRQNQGKGFMPAFIEDSSPVCYGCYSEGNSQALIGIGKKAQDPKRMADFIDWLYSPEGMEIAGVSNGAAGPQGLTWVKKSGKAVRTAFGERALSGDNPKLPKRLGGGDWNNGRSSLNFRALSLSDTDPLTNEPYKASSWSSVINAKNTTLDREWKRKYNQAKTTVDFLKSKNALSVVAGTAHINADESPDITTIRTQCKPVITDSSWKMIFARNQAEFDRILSEMRNTVNVIGYQSVLKVDIKNAREQAQSRKDTIDRYNNRKNPTTVTSNTKDK